MKKKCVIQIEGGIGKHINATAIIPQLYKKYEKVFAFSAYPDIFDGIVDRSLPFQIMFGYEDYMKDADDIFYICNYRESDFRKKRINMHESFCRTAKVDYNDKMQNKLIYNANEITTAEMIAKDVGDFIIVQFSGGKSPYNVNYNQPQFSNNIARDYHPFNAEKVVAKIKEKYNIRVLNYALPNEFKIKGCVEIEAQHKIWYKLLELSSGYIAIDSSLQHASDVTKKKGVVLWGATDPFSFGYKHNINITNECYCKDQHCMRPYFIPSSDVNNKNEIWACPKKTCIDIPVEKVFESICEILGDPKKYKNAAKRDLTASISERTGFVEKKQNYCNCK